MRTRRSTKEKQRQLQERLDRAETMLRAAGLNPSLEDTLGTELPHLLREENSREDGQMPFISMFPQITSDPNVTTIETGTSHFASQAPSPSITVRNTNYNHSHINDNGNDDTSHQVPHLPSPYTVHSDPLQRRASSSTTREGPCHSDLRKSAAVTSPNSCQSDDNACNYAGTSLFSGASLTEGASTGHMSLSDMHPVMQLHSPAVTVPDRESSVRFFKFPLTYSFYLLSL